MGNIRSRRTSPEPVFQTEVDRHPFRIKFDILRLFKTEGSSSRRLLKGSFSSPKLQSKMCFSLSSSCSYFFRVLIGVFFFVCFLTEFLLYLFIVFLCNCSSENFLAKFNLNYWFFVLFLVNSHDKCGQGMKRERKSEGGKVFCLLQGHFHFTPDRTRLPKHYYIISFVFIKTVEDLNNREKGTSVGKDMTHRRGCDRLTPATNDIICLGCWIARGGEDGKKSARSLNQRSPFWNCKV